MENSEYLKISQADGIATITLHRPPLNVLHMPMLEAFNAGLEEILSREECAAVVIRATGNAFCAGVDVADHTPEKVGPMIRRFHGIFRKLAGTDALTIAAVQGAALGGGCELACFCDIVLASEQAKFGQPEVQLGVFPPIAACIFPSQIGIKKAIELTAIGETLTAHQAMQIGLVNHVFSADTFDNCVDKYLKRIQKLSRPVVRLAKRACCMAMREQLLSRIEQAETLYLDELMKLADAREGVEAFIEKRPPRWTHS